MSEGRGVAGVNLWSWGGEGRPLDHRWWVEGDPLTGDPPHEVQGKYAIFDADASTLKNIQALAASFSSAATGTAPTNPTK